MTERYLDFSNWDKDPKQKIPTPEEFTKMVDEFTKCYSDGKILLLPDIEWANAVTKEKQTVYNFPIQICSQNSSHYAISSVVIQNWDSFNRQWVNSDKWVFADRYYHVNIQYNPNTISIAYDRDPAGKYRHRYVLYGHTLCSPIGGNSEAIAKLTDRQLANMYKAQMVGQNYGSPYQGSITSVHNAWTELVMTDSDGHRIPANAPIPQLLTRQPIRLLRNLTFFREQLLQVTATAKDSSYVFVKCKEDRNYVAVLHETYERLANENKLSTIYPVITYQQVQDIQDKLPRQPIDMLVAGLGSAGTGILDQVARSNFINSFYLVDPDIIEEKNLRNQWYTHHNNKDYKANASKYILKSARPMDVQNELIVECSRTKFQEAPLQHYSAKYAVAGFDTIKARLEFLESIQNGTIEAKYLIDTRYDDLTASVYFIDMADEDQVRRYKAGLDADYAAFLVREEERKQRENIQNFDQFWTYFTSDDPENFMDCDEKHLAIGAYTQEDVNNNAECTYCPVFTDIDKCPCGTDACKEHMRAVYEACKEKCKDIRRFDMQAGESSCLRQNFIDIYKYASTFVFAAIREIEEGNQKPFTHIEVQTNKFPSHMIVGK